MANLFTPAVAGSRAVDALTHNSLFFPPYSIRYSHEQLKAGFQFLPGTVVGKITASGKLVPAVATANDGSQTPYGIVCEYVDTTATGTNADTNFSVAVAGVFNYTALLIDTSFGGTIDAAWDAIKSGFAGRGITGEFPSYSG